MGACLGIVEATSISTKSSCNKFTYAGIKLGGSSSTTSGNNNNSNSSTDGSALDRKLEEMRVLDAYNLKVLLLGAGESGKSTVVKQIKLIYKAGGGVSARERQDMTLAIRRNAIECMQVLLSAGAMLSIPLGCPALMTLASEVLAVRPEQPLTEDLAVKIEALWRDSGVQATFDRRSEYWNLDGTPYFLNSVRRFASDDFELTEEDMLMARVRTTGIVITRLPDPPFSLQVVDVGGQRSERRKWIHCFDNVDAIIFLEGLAGYNQVLFEDPLVNRMHESLRLFEEVVANPLFKDTPIYLMLNKKDLFETMIPTVPLTVCFPEYTGELGDVRSALAYVESKFRDIHTKRCPHKQLRIYVIAARVRMDMKSSFGEIKDELKRAVTNRMKAAGR